jgi:hypothetical protein
MNAYGYRKKYSRVRVGDTIGAARAMMPAGSGADDALSLSRHSRGLVDRDDAAILARPRHYPARA